jgi:hypothetical protein
MESQDRATPGEQQHPEDHPAAGQQPRAGPPAVAEDQQHKNRIPNMINITQRPAEAEGDFIIGQSC